MLRVLRQFRATWRARDAWVGFTIFTSVFVCCAIAAMYAIQGSAIARVVDVSRELNAAHLNLFQGFLHVSLSESSDSVWDRGRGLALMQQGVRDMERTLLRMQGGLPNLASADTSGAMNRELEVFTAALRRTPATGAGNSLELRMSFYRLNVLAAEAERSAREEIELLRGRQRMVFWLMLGGSALLLALVTFGAFHAAGREDAAMHERDESDLRFRQMAENIGEVFWLRDTEHGSLLFVSSACRALLGRSPAELMRDPESYISAIHPADRQRMRLAMAGAATYDEEFRIIHPDGSTRWLRERTFPVRDANGRVYRVAGVVEDITQRKAAESSRAASERRLREIIDLVPHQIYAKDSSGRLLLANRATADFYQCEPGDLPGRSLEDLGVDPRHALERHLEDRRLLATGGRIEGALVTRQVRGEHVVLMANKMPFRFHGEGLDSVVVAVTDVTALKRAESQLKQSVALLETTLESTDNGVMVSDAAGTVLLWNKRLLHFLDSAAPLESGAESVVLEALDIQAQRTRPSDGVVRRTDGTFLEYHIQPMVIDNKSAGFVWTFRDVTLRERSAMEAQQREQELEGRVAERTRELAHAYEELEAFSHAVSHDLRAPLNAIQTFIHVLLVRHGDELGAKVRHYIDQVVHASEGMRGMIAALLELSQHGGAPPRRQSLDLTEMAREAYELQLNTVAATRVEFVVQEGLRAHGDPALVATLLQNLIGNALKYSSRRDVARIEVAAEPGSTTRFYVRDNGAGFDPAYAERLFKPFSRLHSSEEFEGHGVGLATAARIVTRHGGRIWAEGVPGQGATFWFTLG